MSFCLQVAGDGDVFPMLAIYAPYVRDTAITFEYEVPTAAEFGARLHHVLPEYPWLVCRAPGQVLGYAYAHRHMERAAYGWNVECSVYVLGSAVGPHPYPLMVRHFQSVIGSEARAQMLEFAGRLPDVAMACVGGGSNAVGLFSGFVHDEGVRLIGVEPGGRGNGYGQHAASLCYGEPGVLHGFNSYMIKDEKGEAGEVYSISAGLDYPSVGPELAELKDAGRAEYVSITDEEALQAFYALSRNEGILPALESSHALAHAMKLAPTMDKDAIILVNLSGRGDKDVAQVADLVNSGAFVPAGD